MAIYKIAEQYSDTPGGRFVTDGHYSGEDFRDTVLIPLLDSLGSDENLLIDFDGAYGYPKSFLEEAFGGLVREEVSTEIINKISFKSDDEPEIIIKVEGYIKDALKSKNKK